MFTGIITGLGKVLKIEKSGREGGITILLPKGWKVKKGESLAVNGVCLSQRRIHSEQAVFDCMAETFRCSALAFLKPGDAVNLERPLTLAAPIGGHLVQGHVDGVGVIQSIEKEGKSKRVRVGFLQSLARYLVEKGSVAVDGVSLTITKTYGDGFSVGLIPITQKATTLGRKRVGERVNIEIDMIVKIVEKLFGRKNE